MEPSRRRHPALLLRILVLLILGSLPLGCGAGLDLHLVNSAQKKPNNVWVFFTVMKGEEPVGGLSADDFEIYEDEKKVSKFESKQTIQNPEVAAVMYTMLLVDMSGSVTESGQVSNLVEAAKSFAERVGKDQKVGVYAFDGSPKLHSVTPFTAVQASVQGGIDGLERFKAKDPSTNLHGAVVEGLRELESSLAKDDKPLKFGTLVVFTDGTDQAARVTREQMNEELSKDEYAYYEFYAIGVGAEMEQAGLEDIGRSGTVLAADHGEVREAFDKVAARVEAHMKRFYLLSYCTPARAGTHAVRIEATKKDKDADEASGDLEYEFDAKGFGPPPACDPGRKPAFELVAPAATSDTAKSNPSATRSGI